MVTWSLDQAYDAYPQIEEEFEEALDHSLDPRSSDMLFDLVAGFGLAPGAVAIDVGCGEGAQAIGLAERFGFSVTGIDPVRRHIEAGRAAAASTGTVFRLGTAEQIPARTRRLIWSGAVTYLCTSPIWRGRTPSSAASRSGPNGASGRRSATAGAP
jgi:SAM-dependent methyltransferase